MLLYVVESSGSSPGRQGFLMAVSAAGELEGTIGGGAMEHKFVEIAKERLQSMAPEPSPGIREQLHYKSAPVDAGETTTHTGKQTILLYIVQPGDAPAIEQVIATLQHNKNGTLVLSPQGIAFEPAVAEKDFTFDFRAEDDWCYRERLGYKHHLFIIGGGHCALALSKMMYSMDFYIRVYDDRIELQTMLENDWAHEKHFVNSYDSLQESIAPGPDHYVVIMTFGAHSDDRVVRALRNKQFKFIGLLGNKAKAEELFEKYREEGIDEEWLQRIHTPVGLPIKSQTPEEIAVSIAAEIIRVKNESL